jgi:hypothetical protein
MKRDSFDESESEDGGAKKGDDDGIQFDADFRICNFRTRLCSGDDGFYHSQPE